MYDKIRKSVFPVLAAFIWGMAFVAQANNTAGAFTFNAMRSTIAFVFLLPIILIFNKGDVSHLLCEREKPQTKTLWIGGALCGLAMCLATYLQQLGMDNGVEPGKASFLTATYIIIVPMLGIFFKKKAPVSVWISAVIALVGLYLLCIKQDFTVNPYDLLVLACAFVFACHILIIDKAGANVDGIKLSCIQFLSMTVISWTCAFIFEKPSLSDLTSNVWSVLYLGVCSSGIAYTLQILAQKDSNPTVTTILLSLESVFGVIAGAIAVGEIMTTKEYIGCALMLVAVILAQIPTEVFKKLFKRKSKQKEYE